jgi:DNA-binding LytR/AlgR family response regulator
MERTEIPPNMEMRVKDAFEVTIGDYICKPFYKRFLFGLFKRVSHYELWKVESKCRKVNRVYEFRVKNGEEVKTVSYYLTDDIEVAMEIKKL